ncbi:RHS repeat domain-containing protein [Ferruginibacter albus]|uniref:RHS repeat domain-containing protein n=1 Tax=Ferruginibacter albus TaxID=2875540 RepID=UPI001CC5F57F|nr:RHS repeat-associated core domain-containing protein [Ferruginibacter albus]UAY53240.1 hypothetical protein K9M53_06105 [Ferruginibacter albus]
MKMIFLQFDIFSKKTFRFLGIIIAIFLTTSSCYAIGDEGIEETILGKPIKGTVDVTTPPTPSLAIAKDAFSTLQYARNTNQIDERIKNVITLSIVEEANILIPDNFTASVTVHIEYGQSATQTTATDQTLTVTFNKEEGSKYNSKSYFSFENAKYVKISIVNANDINVPMVEGVDMRNVLLLTNEMKVTRYYTLANNVTPLPSTFTGQMVGDEYKIDWQWPADAGYNYTQLEWTWLENDENDQYKNLDQSINMDQLFKNNATRVDISIKYEKQYFKIPLYYDGIGKLYYRIRAVNVNNNGTRMEGPWTLGTPYDFTGHEPDLNWQVTTTYAEDGKHKTVMQYFDGSLRNRQTVTKDNVTENVVTAETFYDGQGRAAVQVLPAPGISNVIQYIKGLNLFNGQTLQSNTDPFPGLPKDPAMFSFDINYSTPELLTSSSTSSVQGASQYYSSDNANKAAENAYIPDAEKYPYTVTRYTPDATGRIASQSGVGAAFKAGSGKETKYYYGDAEQEMLDGLFGTEVGNKSHYFKNMVKDANGQMSVSYVDMHGRTIATALAGDAPANLAYINDPKDNPKYATDYPGQTPTSDLTRNLLDNPYDNNSNDNSANMIVGNSIQSVSSILVPATTKYTFNYSLNPQALQEMSCITHTPPTPLCFDCMYNLEFSIVDETGELDNPVILTKKFNNIKLNPDDDCSTPTPLFSQSDNVTDECSGNNSTPNSQIIFCYTLPPGSYSIRKTLTISDESLEANKQLYIKDAICQVNYDAIYNSIKATLEASSDCGNPDAQNITCQQCLDNIGDPNNTGDITAYKNNYLTSLHIDPNGAISPELLNEIQENFSTQRARCNALNPNISHLNVSKRELMLHDMKPFFGQYALDNLKLPADQVQNINTTGNTTGDTNPFYALYDVLYIGATRPTPLFKLPKKEDGTVGAYLDKSGNVYPAATDPTQLSIADFANQFQDQWEEQLLPYHPEYQKLLFAEQNLQSVYDWDSRFKNMDYATAYGQYLSTATSIVDNDPFYQMCLTGDSRAQMLRTNMIKKLQEISSTYMALAGGAKVNMWQAAYGSVIGRRDGLVNPSDATAFTNDCQNAPSKPQVLSYYSGLLNSVEINQFWTNFQGMYSSARESDINQYIDYNVPLSNADQLISKHYILRFPVNNDQIATQSGFNSWYNDPTHSTSVFPTTSPQSQCEAYIATWTNELLQCDQLASRSDKDQIIQRIIDGMESVCERSIDVNNPYGSSNAPNTPTGNYSSFEDVITDVFASVNPPIDISNFCNPYVIESPKPYGKSPQLIPTITDHIDDCYCTQFSQIKEQIAGHINYFSVNAYLKQEYGQTITEDLYNALEDYCDGGLQFRPTGTDGEEASSTPPFAPFSYPQPIPDYLQCNYVRECLTCSQLSSYIQQYYDQFHILPVFAPADNISFTESEIAINESFARFVNYKTGFQLTWLDYFKKANENGCTLSQFSSNTNASQTVVCKSSQPLTDASDIKPQNKCKQVDDMAAAIAKHIYNLQMQYLLRNFETDYRAKCLGVQSIETFSVTYKPKEYHYTLYYYDQAGNLVKTVPPKGVNPNFTKTFTDAVEAAKLAGSSYVPTHTLSTNYRYNSLNQVIAQSTPDANTSLFWYDRLGRLLVSQNAQQKIDNKYSYTVYDGLGRIIEVGQKPQAANSMNQTISSSVRVGSNPTPYETWFNNNSYGSREQITCTHYDVWYDLFHNNHPTTDFTDQQNLRNRVSYTTYTSIATSPSNPDGDYYTGTFYSYDIHGNVNTLLQDYKGVVPIGDPNRFKTIDYDYDLLSGKVNQVSYQPNRLDAFYHRYMYDAENRLIEVQTSKDQIVWEHDAKYNYYKHGLLARTILGQLQVQGLDYAYTLQGWLKGVNSTSLDGTTDIGKDGSPSTGTLGPNPVARDVYGFALHYYDNLSSAAGAKDYSSISGTSAFANIISDGSFKSLYNGNIAGISINNAGLLKGDPATTNADPLFYNYGYDQLNRIVSMKVFSGLQNNSWASASNIHDYAEVATYDPNGNIRTYDRNGAPAISMPESMDKLNYNYYANTNQLAQVEDDPTISNNYTDDIDNQSHNDNYTYDQIGNLKEDKASDITDITWNVYGKIQQVTKNTDPGSGCHNCITYINYSYDATGNRISKTISTYAGGSKTTLYVRDASGNVMSIYTPNDNEGFVQSETYIYGSSRLGMVTTQSVSPVQVNIDAGYGLKELFNDDTKAALFTFTRGEKLFELSNHLGNVLVTVSDRKILIYPGSDANNGGCENGGAKDDLIVPYRNAVLTYVARKSIVFQPGFNAVDQNPFVSFTAYIDPMLQPCTDYVENEPIPVASYYKADVINANDYYPFGMDMPGRSYNNVSEYRYGFNGKEKDKDIASGDLDFGARIYDTRTGRWLSLDPLQMKYPDLSPYNYTANNPISFIDPTGKIIRIYYAGGHYDYTPGIAPPKGSPEIVMKIHEACVYNMHTEEGTKIWNQLASSKGIVEISYLKANEQNTAADSKAFDLNVDNLGKTNKDGEDIIGSLNWDFNTDFSVEDDHGFLKGFLSPSTVLLHELGHAQDADDALTASKKDKDAITKFKASATLTYGYDAQFDTEEEKKNIQTKENVYVRQINSWEQKNNGENPTYQPIRTNHKGGLRYLNNLKNVKIGVNQVNDATRYDKWRCEEENAGHTIKDDDGIKR